MAVAVPLLCCRSLTLEVPPPLLMCWGWHLVGQLGQRRGKGWATSAAGGRRWGVEAVVAAAEHNGGNIRHHWLSLDVQRVVHLVQVPPPNAADAIGVDAIAQRGHGTAGAGRAGGDVACGEASEGWREESDSATEQGGNVGRKYAVPPSCRGCRGSFDRISGCDAHTMKVKKAAREHCDRAERGEAALAMPQRLVPNAILLCDEGDSHKGGGQQVIGRTGEGVKKVLADPDAHMLDPEKIIDIGAGRAAVRCTPPGAKEIKAPGGDSSR